MENIAMNLNGNILTVTIDITKRGKTSGSGKSTSIASTGGNVSIPNHPDIKIGVNCYVPIGK